MKLLDRYIFTTLLKSCLLVLAILLAIFSFMDLVQQLDDVGKGSFQTADAFHYILLSLPARLLEMAPIAMLLGTIAGMGTLNRNSELIAMRAGGVSLARIALAVMKTAVVLVAVFAIVSEYVAPAAQRKAEKDRLLAVSNSGDILGEEGYWTRDGDRFLNIRGLRLGRIPSDIHLFQFSEGGRLVGYLHAREAETQAGDSWLLKDVVRKRFGDEGVTMERLDTLRWQPLPAISRFGRFELPARSLSPVNLHHYIDYLRHAGEDTRRFEIIFWQKIMNVLGIPVLMLLALPFSLGSLRTASFGLRLVLGVMTGLLYLLGNQLLGNLTLLTESNAGLMAALPVATALIAALLLLRRVR